MSLIQFDTAKCKSDGMCAQVCAMGCIVVGSDGPKLSDDPQCIECGHCVAVCPNGALHHEQLTANRFQPFPKDLPKAESLRGLMMSRRSVREYQQRPIPAEVVTNLIDVARYAPTGGNSQQLVWSACVDPKKIKQAAGLAMDFLRERMPYPKMTDAWDRGYDVILRGAPALIVASCPTEYLIGSVDCGIALSYLELAAASEGIGVCWAGLLMMATSYPPLNKLLQIPTDHSVHGALMLGYPKFRYHLVPPRNAAKVTWV